jgi:hypothetical protein
MIALAFFLGMVGAEGGLRPTSDLGHLILAIEMAENTPWSHPGGGLQFTERTWREETRLPYSYAKQRGAAYAVAGTRLRQYAKRLEDKGIEPTAYLLGSIWNKGFTGALRLREKNQKCPYGERVHNLFEEIRTKPTFLQ